EATILLTSLLNDSMGADGRQAGQVAQIVQRTGGGPFFLVSCAQVLRQNARFGATTAQEEGPWTGAKSIRQPGAVRAESARDLLRAAAVIGRRIPGALVQAVALQPEREAVAALEATCQARLLLEVETGKDTTYTFAHDLIREVVLADLSAARRRLLHRR